MEKINWVDFKSTTNPILDAYRVICTNLQGVLEEKDAKLLAFTSLTTKTEKSAVLAGVAIVLAQAGKKVLLIDSNFTEPVQHILFDVPNEGILESVATNSDCFSMVQTCVEQPNLNILASGKARQNVGNVLLSNVVQQFLSVARELYDCILMDVPSLEEGTDAIVVSPKTEGIVIVAAIGEDTVDAMLDAKSRFEQAGATVLGCVMTHTLNANV